MAAVLRPCGRSPEREAETNHNGESRLHGSGENFMHDMPVHVGEATVNAAVTETD